MMRLISLLVVAGATVLPTRALDAETDVKCLAAAEASLAIAGNDNDHFFRHLHHREITTMTGVDVSAKSLDDARDFARAFFRDAVLPFQEREVATLMQLVRKLRARFGERYARLVDRPWNFVKTRKDLCGGFSFTRGTHIVLSERTLEKLVKQATADPVNTHDGERLLLHEQLHVLQRLEPERFQSLYEDVFGFRPVKLELPAWIDTRQVTNPDGVDDQWIIKSSAFEGGYWVGTMLLTDRAIPRMGHDFVTVAIPVQTRDGRHHIALEEQQPIPRLTDLKEYVSRMPIRPSFDHPNEVAAYLLTVITHGATSRPLNNVAKQVLAETDSWFVKNLGKFNEIKARTQDLD